VLLKPDGLYPTKPATEGNKPAKLKAIAAALKRCDQVILATDCDREGQLIGQEILEHLRYPGTVQRALFTAQDPKSLRHAFDKLKPNRELRPLYEAAVARQQADQIFNLSLTRTATRTLLAPGVRSVIGIGRVKTPTLAIVCLREIEIRDFRVEDYFEVVATARVEDGTFLMRHAPLAKARIRDRAVAEAIAEAVQRPTMNFVAIKTPEQSDLLSLHRVRSRLVRQRTAIINQIRGFLLERGITVRQGPRPLRKVLPEILASPPEALSPRLLRLISELEQDWRRLDERLEALSAEIASLSEDDGACQRLMTVPGIGPIISSAVVAAVGTGSG
jgi:hypothetical protein